MTATENRIWPDERALNNHSFSTQRFTNSPIKLQCSSTNLNPYRRRIPSATLGVRQMNKAPVFKGKAKNTSDANICIRKFV